MSISLRYYQPIKAAQVHKTQARYRRQARLWAALEDPDTVFCIVGFAFVGGVCLAGLIGFLMPI